MSVNPIPENYPRVIPYLTIEGAAQAIEFYRTVFDATPRGGSMETPDGKVMHAELEIGTGLVMLSDAGEMTGPGPRQVGGSPVTVMVYVADVDAVYQKAIDAGAESITKPENQFYGDRSGAFTDPFGHKWHVASHIEDVGPEEMERRMTDLFKQMGG